MRVTREEAQDMGEAHAQGYHAELPREGCPECEDRPLRDYPPAATLEPKRGLELADTDGDRLELHELGTADGHAPGSVHVQMFAAHGEVILSPAQTAELREWLRG